MPDHPASPAVGAPTVTVIVPTYREAESLPHLLARIEAVRASCGMPHEVLIVDDASGDGTSGWVASRSLPWLRLIERTTDRGLSQAVCRGMREATGDVLVVMDADLSHPPEVIPALVAAVIDGADFAIGSRYVTGGSTAGDWGGFRRLNSLVATLLARPFTSALDPMSGFFAISRPVYERGAAGLTPVGYKIGLELLVKCRCRDVVEVPIHFSDRRFGQSKLSLKEQVRYLQHLRRLFVYKYGNWAHLAQFLVVGGLGTLVNLGVVTALVRAGMGDAAAIGIAIGVSMLFNFVLHRRLSFSYARSRPVLPQLAGYVAACSVGAAVNFFVALAILAMASDTPPQVAACAGIVAGTGLNFLLSRYSVFRPDKDANSS